MKKVELRKEYLAKRKNLAPGQNNLMSEAICENLFKSLHLQDKFISLFLPIESKNELNTYIIWEKAMSLNVKVAIPKANFENLDLKHILFDSEDQLELSSHGIPEPKKGKIIAADRLEYVFVPLYVADKKGYRVGYGKGFYDRFLAKCSPSCKFIGLSHFSSIDEITDVGVNDVKLHGLITPDEFIWFR